VQSSDYTIGGTAFTINSTPQLSPRSINAVAKYDIYGLSGAGSFRNGNNDYIRFRFPEGVIVPSSIATNQVTINSNGYVERVETEPVTRTATVYLARGNNSSFTVNSVSFLATAGITNPSIPNTGTDNNTVIPSNYKILVSSSQKTVFTETPRFDVQPTNSTMLTIDQVVVSPNVKNAQNVSYAFQFTPTAIGRLQGGTALGSNYVRLFTYSGILNIPNTINPSYVTVNGVACQRVDVVNNNQITVFIPPGVTLEPNVQAEIRFGSQLGFRNVNYSGNVSFAMKTDGQYGQQSGNFAIVNQVSLPITFNEVTLSDNTVNAPSAYTIPITLGTNDDIAQNGELVFTFPENSSIPNSIPASKIRVNGVQPLESAVKTGDYGLIIKTPFALAGLDDVTILISSSAGILNPSLVATNYTISVQIPNNSTGVSPSFGTTTATSTTGIATINLSKLNVQNPAAPGILTDYSIQFKTGDYGRFYSGSTFSRSTITLTFPSLTNLSTIGTNQISVNGIVIPTGDRIINNTTKTVVITVPNAVYSNNQTITVVIPNVTNPSAESSQYTIAVKTSVEQSSVISNPYDITSAGPVTFYSANLVQNIVNAQSEMTIRFRTTTALTANVDKVIIEFPSDISFFGGLESDKIFIDLYQDLAYTNVILESGIASNQFTISPNSNTITALVPENIPGGSFVQIRVTPQVNLRNPREPGIDYSIKVGTSRQPFRVGRADLEFIASVVTSVSDLVVERSSDLTDVPIRWTWRFKTGGNGSLRPGIGTITLRYLNPAISIPSGLTTSMFTLNQGRPVAVVVNGNDIRLTVPANATISTLGDVEIVISSDATIIERSVVPKSSGKNKENPIVLADEEYEVFTSSEPNPVQDNNALPVELIEFNVTSASNGLPVLQWQTATEKENYGFRVEKKFNNSEWDYLGFVKGNGTSTQQNSYSFTDNKAGLEGKYQYKIIQIDYDGKETIYPFVEITINAPEKTQLNANYPNPFNPATTIEFQLARNSFVKLDVYDSIGRKVSQLLDEQTLAGVHRVQFSASKLASGLYFVRLYVDGTQFVHKIMLVK